MPLNLTGGSGLEDQEKDVDVHVIKGKAKAKGTAKAKGKQQSSSSQPHLDDEAPLNVESHNIDDFDANIQFKSVDDWMSNKYVSQLTEKHPSKVSEAMAVERPAWKDTASSSNQSSSSKARVSGHASSTATHGGHAPLPMATLGGHASSTVTCGGHALLPMATLGGHASSTATYGGQQLPSAMSIGRQQSSLTISAGGHTSSSTATLGGLTSSTATLGGLASSSMAPLGGHASLPMAALGGPASSPTVTLGGQLLPSTTSVDGQQIPPTTPAVGLIPFVSIIGGQSSLSSQSNSGLSHASTLIASQGSVSDLSLKGSSGTTPDHTSQPEVLPAISSTNASVTADESANPTDLVYAPGSKKVMLTLQHPLMRLVIQESFENLCMTLLFNHSFPNTNLTVHYVKDALIGATNRYRPGSELIYQQLLHDKSYISKLIPLLHMRISLMRSEIKEQCSAIIAPTIMAMNSQTEIIQYVDKQLADYTYTFPNASNHAMNGLVLRSRPYRNDWIISVIWDLYFTGGDMSFAMRYDLLFTRHSPNDNSVSHEVPYIMVCLVLTALYAALYEWRTGKLNPTEFSANTFMDVYLGHVHTLEHIMKTREHAFHFILTEIYTLVSSSASAMSGNAIAEINLEDLDE